MSRPGVEDIVRPDLTSRRRGYGGPAKLPSEGGSALRVAAPRHIRDSLSCRALQVRQEPTLRMICSGGHMKGRLLFLASVMIPTLVAASGPGPFSYPAAPKSDTAEDHFGHRILDPYRPLEDPNSDATKAWVEAENRLDLRVSRADPRAYAHPRAADEALELRAVHAALEGRALVHLRQERRPSKPTGYLQDEGARRAR